MGYADSAHRLYKECEEEAREVQRTIRDFLAQRDAFHLERAREAWLEARESYGLTEVLRFYNGPIDDPKVGVETLLNAWPLDEAYIDAVEGKPGSGIINDAVMLLFPALFLHFFLVFPDRQTSPGRSERIWRLLLVYVVPAALYVITALVVVNDFYLRPVNGGG